MTHFFISREAVTRSAADAIINSRDLCGNEREAAREAFLDMGITPTTKDMFNAAQVADLGWESFHQAARKAS
jgi:hypothetical protein